MLDKKINKKPKGSALLIALLIMTGVVAVSAGTAQIVLTEVKQSASIDRASLAFYAAETGLEKSMYYVRKRGTDVSFFDKYNELLESKARYSLTTSKTETAVYTSIEKDKSYQLDLFGGGDLIALNKQIKSIKLECAGAPNALIEASWVSWKTDGTINTPNMETQLVDCQNGGSYINLNNMSDDLFHTVRLIARHDDVEGLQITAYDQENPAGDCNCQVSMPSKVVIKSVGVMSSSDGRVNQSLSVSMPLREPVLGVFNSVIFSEESLEKNYD